MRIHPLFAIAVAVASPAMAENVVLDHAGYLVGGDDAPIVAASQALTFRIVDAPSPTGTENILWTGSCVRPVARGYYNAALGDGTCGSALDESLLRPAGERFLEIVVGAVTLSPRLPLRPAPNATYAQSAASATFASNAGAVGGQSLTQLDDRYARFGASSQTGNLNLLGTVAATAFAGDGAQLTGLAASNVVGTLPVDHGGTGRTSFTANGVVFASGTTALGVTGAGASGQVLTSNGAGAAPTFQAVSTLDATKLPLVGGTLSGALSMGGFAITNLATPTTTTGAATKEYVDSAISALESGATRLLARQTVSGSQAFVLFTGLDNACDRWVIEWDDVRTSGHDIPLMMKLAASNDFSAGTYQWGLEYARPVASTPMSRGTDLLASDANGIKVAFRMPDNSTNERMSGQIVVGAPGTASLKHASFEFSGWNEDSSVTFGRGGGARSDAAFAATALRFAPGTGNLLAGTFKVYCRKP